MEGINLSDCTFAKDFTHVNYTDGAYDYIYTELDVIFYRFVLPIILLTGITTNCAFLFVVYRIPQMRTVVNQYLVHISVGDLLFLIGAIGNKLLRFYSTKNVFEFGHLWGQWWDICAHVVNYTTIFASVLIMTLVGFERFYAVCRPMRIYAASTNHKMVKILLAVVWTLSGALALTTIPGMSSVYRLCVAWPNDTRFEGMNTKFDVYVPHNEATMAYVSLVQTVPFFVVMGINTVLYVKMVSTMSGRLGTMQAHDLDVRTNIELRNKVAVMLIINGITFFMLTFPFHLTSFVNGILTLLSKPTGFGAQFKQFFQVLLYCNSLINPVIYNAANSRYRSAFLTAFGFSCSKHGCSLRSRNYSVPLNNGNTRDSPTKNTITTTYSNAYTASANGDILLENTDTQC